MEKKVAATTAPLSNAFAFGDWTISTTKGTIMKSTDAERFQLFIFILFIHVIIICDWKFLILVCIIFPDMQKHIFSISRLFVA